MSMASSSSSPSAPALSSQPWKYDVFLSFRGEDTRKTFVDHLYSALEKQGIYTYKDDETLPRGESIAPSLMEAIEESQIAVIILSENYANSSWCLDELACIMKCKDTKGQIVMPIFYDVDPSEVRKQKRKYGESFANHELENKKKTKSWGWAFVEDPWGWLSAPREQIRKFREAFTKHEVENKTKVEIWRKALVDASNISGWETKHIASGHEAKVIEEIVDQISHSLQLVIPIANTNLIGITARVQDLKSELQIEAGGVRMIGIWGVGGGGKTTLASSVYDEISRKFDGSCFVENIREESSKNGLEKLQEKIVSGILKQKQVQVARVEEGKRMIMRRLCRRKVLIVLDDVDDLEQLKALAGSHDWFGEGSRIIITTRDEHLLTNAHHRVHVIHNISLLTYDEAMELFCKHAPRGDKRIEDYAQLSRDVVSYAGGLPLALTVLGCFLCDKGINEWRSALARLKEIPDSDIVEKLKVSFDGLKPVEKELFLDIACLYRFEKKDGAMRILDACGFHPVIGIKVLIQKALITITSGGRFDMHDLVQEMAHYIVRGEHPNNPERHSRIWKNEDVLTVCAMAATKELDMIQAIRFNGNMYNPLELHPMVASMKNLRSIDWSGRFASPCLTNVASVELYCLRLHGTSQKQLWEGYKLLPNLKFMELARLKNLIQTPDFDGLPNLERFIIHRCQCLEEIHPSTGRLKRLVFLSIKECYSLKMFPPITHDLKKLETLSLSDCPKLGKPSKLQKHVDNLSDVHSNNSGKAVASYKKSPTVFRFLSRCLRKLDLSWCNLSDGDIRSAVWELPNLEELNLASNKFSRLDFSLLQLPQLKWLNLSGCINLVELSELPSSIAVVIADDCWSLESFGDISNCKLLWNLSLRGLNKLGPLAGDILLHSMLQGNAIEHHFISVTLECQKIPKGFVGRLFRGNTFKLRLPDDWYNDFCGFLVCIVTHRKGPNIDIIINQEPDDDTPFEPMQESNEYIKGRSIYIGYVSFGSLRHTALLTSSYYNISFSLDRGYVSSLEAKYYIGAELVPRKIKGGLIQTAKVAADCSDVFHNEHEDRSKFTLQHHSHSSIKILWQPYFCRQLQKVVVKVDVHNERVKQKVMKAVSSIPGIESMAMKDKNLTVIGDVDPVDIVGKINKYCYAETVTIGPSMTQRWCHQAVEDDPNSCVIC